MADILSGKNLDSPAKLPAASRRYAKAAMATARQEAFWHVLVIKTFYWQIIYCQKMTRPKRRVFLKIMASGNSSAACRLVGVVHYIIVPLRFIKTTAGATVDVAGKICWRAILAKCSRYADQHAVETGKIVGDKPKCEKDI
jgi:hypothetical protein